MKPLKDKNTDQELFRDILQKMQRYCAYQERSPRQVREKLDRISPEEFPESEKEKIVKKLIEDRFFDPQRFAFSFVRGKCRLKSWGRVRIVRELKGHGISDFLISEALSEVDEDFYRENLDRLFRKKLREIGPLKTPAARAKMLRYLLSKGYEYDKIFPLVKSEQK